jgi:hypothetical protein
MGCYVLFVDIPNEEADSDSDTEQLKGGTGPSESNVLHSSLHEHDASSITRSSSASKDVVLRCASQVLARSKSSIEQSQFVRNRKQPKVEKNPAETNVSHSSRHKRDKSTVVRPSSAVENETLSSASQASSFKPSNFKRNRIVDSESDVETCEHQLPCMSTKGELVDDSLTFSSEAVSCATQRKGKRKHGDGLSRTVDYDDVENTDQLLPKSTREKLDTMRSKKRSRLDLNDVEPDDVEPDDDDDQYDPSTPNNKKFAVLSVSRTNTAPKSREKWNDEEMMALRSAFHDFLGVNKYPGWKDIIDAQQVFPVLKSRSKEIIKARFVHLKKTGH